MRSLGVALSLVPLLALFACTSDVLNPGGAKAPPAEVGDAAAPPATGAIAPAVTAAPVTAAPVAAAPVTAAAAPGAGRNLIRLDPIVGPSVEAAAPLTERLAQRARARGITLAGSSDVAATTVLKGYFSAMTENAQTTVVYVWDLYDTAGNRLHRINGQEQTPASGAGQGWGAVPPDMMRAIADKTADQLAAWMAARPG